MLGASLPPAATVPVQFDARGDYTLLTSAAVTGSGVAILAGRYNWVVYGTFDGATAQLQFSPDSGSTWIDFDGINVSANGGWQDLSLAAGSVRVVISAAGGSTSLSSTLGGVS